MKLHVTGLNHRTAPVEVREKVAFQSNELPTALKTLREHIGLPETMILSTCNRVEVIVAAEEPGEAAERLAQYLGEAHRVDAHRLRPHLYQYHDREAIQHLFRVAASLDSMVLGEPQILGQLKDAYQLAKEQGLVSPLLDTVLPRAFNVAKRVRSETTIGQSAVSVSYAAVELAREIFGNLRQSSILLVGAGKMSELAARHLLRNGAPKVLVTNRTRERAAAMAAEFAGQVVDYERFREALSQVDIVITSSGAPHYILTREDVRKVMGQRKGRPLFLIDIAVPRNIEPDTNTLENVFLYDIDDLGRVVEANRKNRAEEAAAAEKIVAEEVDRLLARIRQRSAGPQIQELQEQLEKLRLAEMERIRGKLGALSAEQEAVLEALTRSLVNKLAHGPMVELRKAAGEAEGGERVQLIRRMFRLDEE